MPKNIPTNSYGILERESSESLADEITESVRNLGYGVFDSGFDSAYLDEISDEFSKLHKRYIERHGAFTLENIDELNTIRTPLIEDSSVFLSLALNKNLLAILKKIITGKFILNQQNGIINPPQKPYNQGA